MRLFSTLAVLTASVLTTVIEASSLTPPLLPLVVRNPYLSTWLPNAREEPWKQWPIFWTGEHVGFSILASVPAHRISYPLLGRPQDSLRDDDKAYNVSYPIYVGSQYDASTTNLSYIIRNPHKKQDDIEITISFLSPITPTSTLRQSIPASYLTFYVTGSADVDIYVDLNGQWVSGDRGNEIEWELHHHSADGKNLDLKTWSFRRATEQLFTEYRDQAEWGTLHFSAPAGVGVRHEAGESSELRQRFSRTGTLQNHNEDRYRGIMDQEPVFAFAKSFLGNETKGKDNTQSITFTIAHIQDPVIQYAAERGLTFMKPFWTHWFPTEAEIIAFHYGDFAKATELARRYSEQLAIDAYKSGAEDYVDIVAISARQVLGATHFVGTPEDPLLFLKEISSDGNTQTIDVIFPAFPFFMYTNPRWLAYLLEPLIEHMGSGQYPNKYAMHDLGASYPNATGHPDGYDERMPVEECGNILIMGLALANALKYGTNVSTEWTPIESQRVPQENKIFPLTLGKQDGIDYIDEAFGSSSSNQAQKWVQRSYKLWKQWTVYLVDYSLEPENQLSTDDFAGPLELQTNLALKGIIGIKAMAGLSDIAGKPDDSKEYEKIAKKYISKWEEYGISRDKTHAKVAYNWFGSWSTIYNLYADTLLCFHLESSSSADNNNAQSPLSSATKSEGFVPKHIYQMASTWYYNVRQKYGLPLDSRHLYAKSDWEFFAMAVAAPEVRADILESVARWVNETNIDRPLTDLYDTEHEGGFPGPNFYNRPVVGGHFAFLSLEKACGGKAMDGLKFLDESFTAQTEKLDIDELLKKEMEYAFADGLEGRYGHQQEGDIWIGNEGEL